MPHQAQRMSDEWNAAVYRLRLVSRGIADYVLKEAQDTEKKEQSTLRQQQYGPMNHSTLVNSS